MKKIVAAIGIICSALFLSCGTTSYRTTPGPVAKSPTPEAKKEPVQAALPDPEKVVHPKEEQKDLPSKGTKRPVYRLAVVLPFLTDQEETDSPSSQRQFAVQFYAGMQLAFESMSILAADYPQLVVDVLDTKGSEEAFEELLRNPRLNQAEVIIGPNRNAPLLKLANWAKANRKILISPQSPSSSLVEQYPGFVQLNPSLKTHCARVIQYLRKERGFGAEQLVLVGKEKEADRFSYFQEVNKALLGSPLKEIILPDQSANFEKIDFGNYCRYGKTTAFIMPSWAGQDWIVSFLSRLKRTKGTHTVEVYGMPQWLDYAQIEAELLRELNVHVTTASFIDHKEEQVRTFERSFVAKFGTLPEEEAFAGWDAAFFVAAMLQRYGLSFPEKATASPELFPTFRGGFYLRRNQTTSAPVDTEAPAGFNYSENIMVHILRFDQYDFIKI